MHDRVEYQMATSQVISRIPHVLVVIYIYTKQRAGDIILKQFVLSTGKQTFWQETIVNPLMHNKGSLLRNKKFTPIIIRYLFILTYVYFVLFPMFAGQRIWQKGCSSK